MLKEMQKQNMQMRQEEAGEQSAAARTGAGRHWTPLQEMNLIDDFLFDVMTTDLEACRIIIELSLNRKLRRIRWREGQKVLHNLPGKRGVRMDFYAEDMEGNLFDVEMQKRNVGNIPKRTRFYQALVDAPLLERGEKGFDRLNSAYIVVICGFDLYGFGKYRYTFGSYCEEVPGLIMGDGCKKIILNTKGRNADEVEKPLVDFLRYVEQSDDDALPEDCDERLRYLHAKVKHIKASRGVEVSYMKMEERDRLIREEGIEKGIAVGAQKKLIQIVCVRLQRGDQPEQIADDLGEETALIRRICTAAQTCAPEYDCGKILAQMEA